MSIDDKLDKICFTLQDIAKTNKESFFVLKELLKKLNKEEVIINSPISVKSEEAENLDINKFLYKLAEKISRRHPPQTMSNKEFTDRLTKVLVESEKAVSINKKFITRTIEVFKQQVESNLFVKVGTMTDNVLILDVPKGTIIDCAIFKPSTYFTDWFVKNTDPELGCQWLDVYPSNEVNQILVKFMPNKSVTTGHIADDGKVVYYDQYLAERREHSSSR